MDKISFSPMIESMQVKHLVDIYIERDIGREIVTSNSLSEKQYLALTKL